MNQQHSPRKRRLKVGAGKATLGIDVVAGSVYDGLVRDAIRHWKYDGTLGFTNWFAFLVQRAVQRDLDCPFDAIVAVPTSADRLRKRGYHHVGLLARAVSELNQIPVEEWLVRSGDVQDFTQSQTVRTAVERRKRLTGAFTLASEAAVNGKRILLLDDIVTTGATLHTCASALLDAGAVTVACAVIADVL